jgi:hypothetical protein
VIKHVVAPLLVAGLVLGLTPHAYAQEAEPPARAASLPTSPVVEILRVQIVIAKYQGEKKSASAVYELMVPTNGNHKMLRVGVQVPLNVAQGTGPSTVLFKDVGVAIDCAARPLDGGRYTLDVTVSDSSIYTDDQRPGTPSASGGPPVIRSFQTSSTLVVRPGVSSQFGVATDKVSGDVTKADVTVTVVK